MQDMLHTNRGQIRALVCPTCLQCNPLISDNTIKCPGCQKTLIHFSLCGFLLAYPEMWPLVCITVYLLQQQYTQLLSAVFKSESVCAVHYPHQPVCALKVVPPVRAKWLLSPYIPNIQFKPGQHTERRERVKSGVRRGKIQFDIASDTSPNDRQFPFLFSVAFN